MYPHYSHLYPSVFLSLFLAVASNIVLMSAKAVLVDFGLTVQMTEDVYIPRDLRGTEVSVYVCFYVWVNNSHSNKKGTYDSFHACDRK